MLLLRGFLCLSLFFLSFFPSFADNSSEPKLAAVEYSILEKYPPVPLWDLSFTAEIPAGVYVRWYVFNPEHGSVSGWESFVTTEASTKMSFYGEAHKRWGSVPDCNLMIVYMEKEKISEDDIRFGPVVTSGKYGWCMKSLKSSP